MKCIKCKLHRRATKVKVSSRGSDKPIILFVGEAPGKTENERGLSFIGRSGEKLADLCDKAGIDPDWCRWTNIVRCIPWRGRAGDKVRAPNSEEIDGCCGYLEAEIKRTKPIFIVPLGASAAGYFLGDKTKIGSVRGKRYPVELPTIRHRYNRMRRFARKEKLDDPRLIKTSDPGKQQALQRAIKLYGYEDVETNPYTVFPTIHPASVFYGSPDAEMNILGDLNYLASRILQRTNDSKYEILTTVEDVVGVMSLIKERYLAGEIPYVCNDLETTSLNSFDLSQYITTTGFCCKEGEAWSIPIDHHESPFKGDNLAQQAIKAAVNDMYMTVPVVNQNIKYDYEFGLVRGWRIRDIYDDTELMGWTLTNDTAPHNLDYLTTKYTDFAFPKQEMKEAQALMPKEERYNTDNYELDLVGRYNCADVDSVIRLIPALEQELENEDLLKAHRRYTVPAILPTIDMELNGVFVDQVFLQELKQEMEDYMEEVYDSFEEWGLSKMMENAINDEDKPKRKEFKLSSPEQVSILLFDLLSFEPRKFGKVRKNGKHKGKRIPSSDKNVLQSLLEEVNEKVGIARETGPDDALKLWEFKKDVVGMVQEFKGIEQQHKMYLKNMPALIDTDGFTRASYGVRRTDTGRYNCVEPALQTIPWHSSVKQMFPSRWVDGLIVNGDYAQNELRVFAMETGDEELINTFLRGEDIHRMISSRVLDKAMEEVLDDERRRMKTVVFGLLYGRGAKAIAAQEDISVQRAKDIIQGVFDQFPKVKKFIEQTHKYVRRYGEVRYINGFRRIIPGDYQDTGKADRQAVNSKIQGPASDLAVAGMINMFNRMKKLKLYAAHFAFVHDSLGYDTPPGELYILAQTLKKELADRPPKQFDFINVPLKVDFEVGLTWGQLVEMSLLPNGEAEFSGEEENWTPLWETMCRWDDAPELVDYKEETKSKTAIVRALMRSGIKVDYQHSTARVKFPKFTRRTPVYAHKPMISAA